MESMEEASSSSSEDDVVEALKKGFHSLSCLAMVLWNLFPIKADSL
jgi:hypothetical protein